MNKSNRIFFLDNPYPNGHEITEFVWEGRMEEDGTLWFDFHLKTDDYYSEDRSDDPEEAESDWKAKIVWGNYHRCTISSTEWGEERKGMLIGKAPEKFNFDHFIQSDLLIDRLPLAKDMDYEELAFNIYLLGHDSCADHKIKISASGKNSYDIEWTGKIALTYSGNYKFEHSFRSHIQDVKFEGFRYPRDWTTEKATAAFKEVLDDFDHYKLIDPNPESTIKEYRFVTT